MLAALRHLVLTVMVGLIAMSAWPSDKPPDQAKAAKLNNLGVAYMNQQRMDKAVEEFDQALKADPDLTAAELNKGIALLNLQKLPEAQAALDAAAAKEPSNPRVWYNLGLLRRSQGKPAEAIDAFQRVLKIDPNDPDTHYFLGTMYSQQQQYAKAIAEFEAVLRLQPSACVGTVRSGARASALWQRGRCARAPADLRAPDQDQSLLAHDAHVWRTGALLDGAGSHYSGAEGRADDSGDVRRAADRPCNAFVVREAQAARQAAASACWM